MDLSKVKSALTEVNKIGSGSKSDEIFKPDNGTTNVRIVPLKTDPQFPFFQAYIYYGFGARKGMMISPYTFGGYDPIFEFAKESQMNSGGDKEVWKQAKKMEPKTRFFAPVLIRGREEEGVKFWEFSSQIYEDILKICDDPDYGSIEDLQTGTDLVIEKKSPEEAGNQYGEISVRARRNPSPVAPPEKINEIVELIKNQPNWKDVSYFKPTSVDELQSALDMYMSPSEDEAPNEGKASNPFGDVVKNVPKETEQPKEENKIKKQEKITDSKVNLDSIFGD